ncbi:uncharacterized protein LOC132572401 isoform X2 [Heteronotia binoei]|uniref:uncharacterized protein LOC132572401 isoform X2 n=1 Tax=Heteronotia binoei TaxID=13085 RepID=UPI002930BE44|nr:uncharacterized protein LOC132572401 isoform X2 [Heteronotia binoei]
MVLGEEAGAEVGCRAALHQRPHPDSQQPMNDPVALREADPCSCWTVGGDASSSSSGPAMPLCAEMSPGVTELELISKQPSLRKRKDSLSGTGCLESSPSNPAEEGKVNRANCEGGGRDQSPAQINEDDETVCRQPETADGLLLEAPLRPKKRKLVLHIDLNNTILVSDAVTNQDPSAALNYYLSTVTWGKVNPAGKWQWLSKSPSLLPPCPDAVNFYSQFGRDTTFTTKPLGQPFRDLHAHHLRLLEWPGQPHPTFSIPGEQPAKRYHLVLPSFFHLLQSLHREGRHFTVVFRTFGTDLPRVLQAMHCALEGQHPHFPVLRDIPLPVDLSPGKIRCSKRKVTLTQGAERLSTEAGDREMYMFFSSKEGLCGFQDHFDWWASNQYSSQGGKPLWINPHDANVHHICIDDNIRLNDSDTIVHPRMFSRLGEARAQMIPTSELYDICLVQTDLLEAIADMNYFCRCVRRCEENYERFLARAGGHV